MRVWLGQSRIARDEDRKLTWGGLTGAINTIPRGLDFILMAVVSSLKLGINMVLSMIQKGKPKNTLNSGRKRRESISR